MTKDLNEKLDQLNPAAYSSTDAAYIRSWKQRLPTLMAQADFLNHPITQDLKKEIEGRIQAIRNELADNEHLTKDDEMRLRGEKRAHDFYLAAFSQDPAGELKVIEQAVNMELQ